MKKEDAFKLLLQSVDLYERNLKNKNLLFLCMDKHNTLYAIETLFLRSNFLHLTGVKFKPGKALHANEFYSRCLDRRLRMDDFEFDTKGTTQMKLSVLPQLFQKNLGAIMAGNFTPQGVLLSTEKLIGNERAVLGFVFDPKRNAFLPNTSLKGDVRNYVDQHLRIIATYRKPAAESTYQEIVYESKTVNREALVFPKEWAYLQNLQSRSSSEQNDVLPGSIKNIISASEPSDGKTDPLL